MLIRRIAAVGSIGATAAVAWYLTSSQAQPGATGAVGDRSSSTAMRQGAGAADHVPPVSVEEATPSRVRTRAPAASAIDVARADVEQARARWERRLVGERLSLAARSESLRKLTLAMERAPSAELEQRRKVLESKYVEQARRVDEIERRLEGMDEAG